MVDQESILGWNVGKKLVEVFSECEVMIFLQFYGEWKYQNIEKEKNNGRV